MDSQATNGHDAAAMQASVDDGRRYLLVGPSGVDEFLDNLRPDAGHHAVTVCGSADLARRVVAADRAGVCVAWRRLDDAAGGNPAEDGRGGGVCAGAGGSGLGGEPISAEDLTDQTS